jgi:hypothetical protein
MNFGEWMAVDISPEKLFKLEAECRALERSTNTSQIAAQLLRQCSYQQEVLQAAVHEIARLELELMQR